jgi:hypothetical protein
MKEGRKKMKEKMDEWRERRTSISNLLKMPSIRYTEIAVKYPIFCTYVERRYHSSYPILYEVSAKSHFRRWFTLNPADGYWHKSWCSLPRPSYHFIKGMSMSWLPDCNSPNLYSDILPILWLHYKKYPSSLQECDSTKFDVLNSQSLLQTFG